MGNYEEYLVWLEFHKLLEKRLVESFRDGSYWKSSDSESQSMWNKLRNKRWKKNNGRVLKV